MSGLIPNMPKNLDLFRKAYSNSYQGFHVLTDKEKKDEAAGNIGSDAGRTIESSFQGPIPEGEKVDYEKQKEFQGLMTKAQTAVDQLSNVANGSFVKNVP